MIPRVMFSDTTDAYIVLDALITARMIGTVIGDSQDRKVLNELIVAVDAEYRRLHDEQAVTEGNLSPNEAPAAQYDGGRVIGPGRL